LFGCCDGKPDFVSYLVELKGEERTARLFVADHGPHTFTRFKRISQFQYEIASLVFLKRVFVQLND